MSYARELGAMTDSQRFFLTSGGYMGLAPAGTKKDDHICIFLGCSVPLVLREVGEEFLLIGECFVLGLMDGEVLKGGDWETYVSNLTII